MPPTQGGRRRHRTFTCDETRPWCSNCRRIGIQCSGYDFQVVWMEQETLKPFRTDGRRILRNGT
ncbi:hypothetical protein LB505_013585 [Fusarium chuoi]|nr:hypothetical protein LB505_013585 [Fusarium chuoi]